MKLVAPDLKQLGLIDDVIREPLGGAHHDHDAAASAFSDCVRRHLAELSALPMDTLLNQRYEKFRNFGEWQGSPGMHQ
jgi:acetyl-CoA carboxylase carboxyl transferase subunit alpha